MTPQPSIQQLDHAIANLEKLVEAKKIEIDAYAEFRDTAQAVLADLMDLTISKGEPTPEHQTRLRVSLTSFFEAQRTVALIALEEVQMMLAARRQQRTGIVSAAGMVIDPFKNSRH